MVTQEKGWWHCGLRFITERLVDLKGPGVFICGLRIAESLVVIRCRPVSEDYSIKPDTIIGTVHPRSIAALAAKLPGLNGHIWYSILWNWFWVKMIKWSGREGLINHQYIDGRVLAEKSEIIFHVMIISRWVVCLIWDNFTVHWFCMRCNESSSHCCYRCCHNGGCVQWTVHHTHTMVHTWIFNFYPVNSKYPVAENKQWSVTCDVYSWCLLVYNMSDDMMTGDHWTMVWPRTGTGAKLTSGLLPPLHPSYLQPRLFRMWPCVMSS